MKTIAFDIDGTWTLAPWLFAQVAEVFSCYPGWQVILVTGAPQDPKKLEHLECSQYKLIIARNGEYKIDAARRCGYTVDVWVDDMPGFIEPTRILIPCADDKL